MSDVDPVVMERARAVRFLRLLAVSFERNASAYDAAGKSVYSRDDQRRADTLRHAASSLAGGDHTHCYIDPLNPFAWPDPS